MNTLWHRLLVIVAAAAMLAPHTSAARENRAWEYEQEERAEHERQRRRKWEFEQRLARMSPEERIAEELRLAREERERDRLRREQAERPVYREDWLFWWKLDNWWNGRR